MSVPRLLAAARPATEARYARAAVALAAALRAGDAQVLSELADGLAVLLPEGLAPLACAAAAAGHGLAALRIAAAHLGAGGSAALLGARTGDVRLIQAAEAAVVSQWGDDPAAAAEGAGLLARLFRVVDPTDSYLYAATWGRRAAGCAAAPPVAARSGPALVARVWSEWFGLRRTPQGLTLQVHEQTSSPGPRTLQGVPLRGSGWADVEVVGERVRVRRPAGTMEVAVGETVPLEE